MSQTSPVHSQFKLLQRKTKTIADKKSVDVKNDSSISQKKTVSTIKNDRKIKRKKRENSSLIKSNIKITSRYLTNTIYFPVFSTNAFRENGNLN